MNVIALDTGILLHAAFKNLPHHKHAFHILELARVTDFIGCISEQVLFEFYSVATRFNVRTSKVVEELGNYRQIFAMIHPKPDTYARCLDRANELKYVTGSQIYDIYLAQTAIDNNISSLLTFNLKHFRRFKLPINILDAAKY